jgi:hypothetical protein
MAKEKFTKEELFESALNTYGGPICVDLEEYAMKQETLEQAVDVLVVDSIYWDGLF